MTSYSTHTRMNPRQRSTRSGVTVRGMFSLGPAPAPSGGRAKPRRKPLFPSPVPEPLGRRTLDFRASIMLAPIIISKSKMSTLFFPAFQHFPSPEARLRRFRLANSVLPRRIPGVLCALSPADAGASPPRSGKTTILGKVFDFIRQHATIGKCAPPAGALP